MNVQSSPPARANQTQRELVRILYLEHGHQKASELSGVRYDLVRQWAHRYKWDAQTKRVTNVTKAIADRVSDELADNERETRLSLSRYAKRAAQDSENATLMDAPLVHKAAQVAGIVHKWGDNDKQGQSFTLNVLNMGAFGVTVGDSEAEP